MSKEGDEDDAIVVTPENRPMNSNGWYVLSHQKLKTQNVIIRNLPQRS